MGAQHFPFNYAPNNHIAEPVFFTGALYFAVLLPSAVFGNFIMRRAQDRWPSIGKVGLVAICLVTFMVLDLIFEPAWMRLGAYSYGQ